jgi:serine phosphatase RsbU (regulator of sigma subunit)
VTAAVPSLQTPLASAAVLAESTNGDAAEFRRLMGPIVKVGRPFTSVSLWSTTSATKAPLVVVGGTPELAAETPAQVRAFFRRAVGSPVVAINNLLNHPDRRLGYALSVPTRGARYLVYGEAILPKERRARIDKDSAFADLGYALYMSPTVDTRYLLASSTGGALLHGRRASVLIPFGNAHLLVQMTPLTDLGGSLLARLWWILGVFGLLLTLGAATLVERLTRRRIDAEGLAVENARLYAEQRSVAQTLQHSLLAEAFPDIERLEFAARYVAGVEGIDIGGDWYDVVRLDDGNILIVVGDVSGRGLDAATMMASLRFAARAYAVEGHSPALILTKLSALVSVARDEHFATVLCGLLNVADGRVTVANAGHPEPLLVSATGAELISTNIGVPVGVGAPSPYTEVSFVFPPGSTLLLYTDGAIERRGEHLDVGLDRLKQVSLRASGTLDEFLDKVSLGVISESAEDDTAMLGVRWRGPS